jgi:integrase
VFGREEYAKLLAACPNQEWRVIIAAARIGGLRCPSELKYLRWSDVNWEQNRFLVQALKTKRFSRHRERVVPLFSEWRVELDRLFSQDTPEENEFVIQSFQGKCWFLRNTFYMIARKVGLGEILRPFDNMRMSRSNEILAQFGETKKSMWIGHSRKVMQDHYLLLSDDDFSAAAAGVGLSNKSACETPC